MPRLAALAIGALLLAATATTALADAAKAKK